MIYKRGSRYYVKFKFSGRVIRKATHAKDLTTARRIEVKIRSTLAEGEWGILERDKVPFLKDFLEGRFLSYAERTVKPATLRYYKYGIKKILDAGLGSKKMYHITSLDGTELQRKYINLSPSTINTALRVLHRALNLAEEWGVTKRVPKIKLARGEKKRDRVLTKKEQDLYLSACKQPWLDIATIMLETGLRPGEVFCLKWSDVNFTHVYIQIQSGKTESARRRIPMTKKVLDILYKRCDAPEWVFPADNKDSHVNRDTVKKLHWGALRKSGVDYFVPYSLRHTALTEFGTTTDPYTLSKISGHGTINMTERYVHPQFKTIQDAFKRKEGGTEEGHSSEPNPVK